MILAIDPGPEQSAFVLYRTFDRRLLAFGKFDNGDFGAELGTLAPIIALKTPFDGPRDPTLVVEMIASYGMAVGREVFETCVWIGRFLEAWRGPSERITRGAVKMHLCGSMRAKDGNVRAALIDAFGGKDKAIGSKKQPGPLHGVSGDVWAALAVAVTYADRTEQARAA